MTRNSALLVLVVTAALVTAASLGAGAVVLDSSTDTAGQADGQADDIRVRLVHASPDAPPVDVSVGGEVVVSGLAFGEEASIPVEAAGDYAVEIAAAGNDTETNETGTNESAVLFSENVTLEAGTDYTIAAAGEVTPGASTAFEPLVLVENETTVGEGETAIGLVHLSPDAPAVDVTDNATGEVIFENVTYRNATEQFVLPAGEYTLDVRVESETNDGEVVDSFDVSLSSGTTYTAFAIGYAATENATEEQAFTLLLSADDVTGEEVTTTEEGTATEEEMTEGSTETAAPTATETPGPNQ